MFLFTQVLERHTGAQNARRRILAVEDPVAGRQTGRQTDRQSDGRTGTDREGLSEQKSLVSARHAGGGAQPHQR